MLVSSLALRPSLAPSQPVASIEQPAATPHTVDVYTPAPPSTHRVEGPKKLDVDTDAIIENLQHFTDGLTTKVGLAAGACATVAVAVAAIGQLLADGRALYARNPNYVPMALLATSDKVDRVKQAGDVSAALRQERLDAPLANFGVVADGRLYRGGQPSRAGLAWLAQHGVKTVVTLRRREVEDHYGYVDFTSSQEGEECRRAGMRLVEIPITDNAVPTQAEVQKFLDVMDDPQSGPVYVHCAAGAGRTGVMCGIYERRAGVPIEQVEKDLVHYYLNPNSPHGAAQLDSVRNWPVTGAPQHEGWLVR